MDGEAWKAYDGGQERNASGKQQESALLLAKRVRTESMTGIAVHGCQLSWYSAGQERRASVNSSVDMMGALYGTGRRVHTETMRRMRSAPEI